MQWTGKPPQPKTTYTTIAHMECTMDTHKQITQKQQHTSTRWHRLRPPLTHQLSRRRPPVFFPWESGEYTIRVVPNTGTES